ncbi:DUF6612 family protein [Camelliibacillus cellulosilyticus]|uniref:DUF6612 family protein n=1 Tax=Camelliibacillus cellulosilyticus TaxID=2174486 RepID=A0ABV9GTA6_9BACL
MKLVKTLLLLVSLTLVFGLTACGSKSAEDVFKQASQKAKDIKNFKNDLTATIKLTNGGDSMEVTTDAKVQAQVKPAVIHMNMGMHAGGDSMNMETYLNNNDAFMKITGVPQWIKVSDVSDELNLNKTSANVDPKKLFDQLKDVVDKMELKDTKDGYEFHVKSTDGKMDKFLKKYVKESMPNDQQSSKDIEQAIDNMKIKKVDLTYIIDKKTYYPKKFNMNLTADLKDESGNKMTINENAKSSYHDINKTDAIKVPDDVKNNAIEVPKDQLQGL